MSREFPAMPITVRPIKADLRLARAIASNTRPAPEEISGVITWGADEHLLIGLTLVWWLVARGGTDSERRTSNHVLLTTAVAAVAPHLLKSVFNQIRPDRRTILAHFHDVPLSGNAEDAFPSGHAVHVGALASAASQLPPAQRNAVWAVSAALVSTRLLLLAHWASDVVAGLALGAALERCVRLATGFGRPAKRRQ
jgi:membrane-associated phospholipid phosphatase